MHSRYTDEVAEMKPPEEEPLKYPALFLDRDGVINHEIGYLHKQEDVRWVDGIFSLCRTATSLGYKVVVVTNQAGIARGYYTTADFEKLMQWMCSEFMARLDGIYYCPYHPEHGIGEYLREHGPQTATRYVAEGSSRFVSRFRQISSRWRPLYGHCCGYLSTHSQGFPSRRNGTGALSGCFHSGDCVTRDRGVDTNPHLISDLHTNLEICISPSEQAKCCSCIQQVFLQLCLPVYFTSQKRISFIASDLLPFSSKCAVLLDFARDNLYKHKTL